MRDDSMSLVFLTPAFLPSCSPTGHHYAMEARERVGIVREELARVRVMLLGAALMGAVLLSVAQWHGSAIVYSFAAASILVAFAFAAWSAKVRGDLVVLQRS